MLVRADDEEPTIKKSGTGDDEVFMMQHTKVIAVAAKNPKPFSVEAFCQLEQTHHFNMADHKVHLLVGKVSADDQGANMTVIAQKIFKLTTDEQMDAVEAERRGICGLQMSTTQKRPASVWSHCRNACQSESGQVKQCLTARLQDSMQLASKNLAELTGF